MGMESHQPHLAPVALTDGMDAWRDRRRPFLFKKTAEVSVPWAWAAKRERPSVK